MNYDGKTYRNLEGQVGYLTDVLKQLDDRITEVAANIPSKMIVEELPETGDPNITYYVGPKGTEPNLYYEVWVWVQEEEEGPFVWRELEDTDQVDLSGYLPKDTSETTRAQVYAKNADGTQTMVNLADDVEAYWAVRRGTLGNIFVPTTPGSNISATSKKYVDDNFVAKRTTATTYPQAYYKKSDGTQDTYNMSYNAVDGTIMLRSANGQVMLPNQGTYVPTDDQAISKRFGDSAYLAKQTGNTTYNQVYVKKSDGTQEMVNVSTSDTEGHIVRRSTSGQIFLPNQTTYEPSIDQAISRRYADSHYGSGVTRYAHHVVASITMTNGEIYPIVVNYVNGTGTPSNTAFGNWESDLYSVAPYNMGENSDSTKFRFTVLPFITNNYPGQDTAEGFLIHKIGGSDVVIDGSEDANIDSISSVDTVYQI